MFSFLQFSPGSIFRAITGTKRFKRSHEEEESTVPINYELEYKKLKEEVAVLKETVAKQLVLEKGMANILKAQLGVSPLPICAIWPVVTFIVGGERMSVHRNVISARAPGLAAFLETKKSEIFEVNNIQADLFQIVLRYLYTEEVPFLERQAATKLMVIAKQFKVHGLEKCLIGRRLTTIPDLCLIALFGQMTLNDQITARKVCRRWDSLVLEVTRKRKSLILLMGNAYLERFEDQITTSLFSDRQALRLLLNADGTPLYPTKHLTFWNSLYYILMDETYTPEDIATTFSETKELQVAIRDTPTSQIVCLTYLLQQWPSQLITLKLSEDCSDPLNESAITCLYASINGLSALKQLYFDSYNLPESGLSIISQLEELRFYSESTTQDKFARLLQEYGEGNRALTRIEYEDCAHIEAEVPPFDTLSEHLRHCFTRLGFYHMRDLAVISAHFPNFTSLRIHPPGISVRNIITNISNFKQLIHLYIDINSTSFADDDMDHLMLPQAKSVKALELKLWFEMPAHQQLAKMELGWTLPNVEAVRFEFDERFHCNECAVENFSQPSEAAKSCLRLIFSSLKRQCTKLRRIQHNLENVFGTVEEGGLLAE